MKAAARHTPPPKCDHCHGWGFEPGQPANVLCTICGGSGKPPPAPAPPQTGELIDG